MVIAPQERMFCTYALSAWFAASGVRADYHGTHGQCRRRRHDRADKVGLVVELL